MSQNFPFLFQYLKKENITIDQNEFNFQIQSHSNYPSLLAISDTLNFLNIDNLVTQLDFEDIVHLPKNFIALLKNEKGQSFLTLVEKESSNFKYQDGKKQVSVPENDFQNIFQNIVLLVEKEENNEVKIKSKSNSSFLLLLGLFLYLVFLFLSKSGSDVFIFSIFSIVGIYLSVEAIFKEVGIQSKFSESVCNITSSSDCDSVIKTKGLNFLEKINYSNFSVSFFISQLFLLFAMQIANKTVPYFELQFVLLLFSIPITFLSVYHQIKVAKKWCPICLLIIFLLYIQISLIAFTKPLLIQLDVINMITFFCLFTTIYFIVNTIKKVFKIKNEQQQELFSINRFKRNYELFKLALGDSQRVKFELNENAIVVGNRNAAVKITLVTNPFCGFCKETHEITEKFFKIYKNEICINFQFNCNIEKEDSNSKEIHNMFLQIYFNEGEHFFMESLNNWFTKNIKPIPKSSTIDELKIHKILNEQFLSNQSNNINFTPCIIINNALFPKMYDRKDLIYFIPELINELQEK